MISVTLEHLDRESSVAVFRASAEDKSARVRVDFINREVSAIDWGDGNGFVAYAGESVSAAIQPPKPKPKSVWLAATEFIDKVGSFGAAVASKAIQGPVTGAAMDFRRQCCFGVGSDGVRVSNPCSALITKGRNSYCKSCGCGTMNPLARLNPRREGDWDTSKLAYPDLPCPKDKFSPITVRQTDRHGHHLNINFHGAGGPHA